MPLREELEALALRWIEEGWRKGDAESVLALYAPGFVDFSSPYGERGTGAQNVAGIRALYAAFPDFYTEIDDLIIDCEAGKVAIRWTATGTHRGDFLDLAPTGRRITFRGIETLRIRDGQIIERAGEWDGFAIVRQISEAG